MRAVGYTRALPIDHPEALVDVILPEPTPGPHDLLVDIKAISVNPADTKVRRSTNPAPGETKGLGWDAAGGVRALGADVAFCQPRDEGGAAEARPTPGRHAAGHARAPASLGEMPH